MSRETIFGIRAPAPRPTVFAAALLGLLFALPVGLVLWIIEVIWY